MPFLSTVSAVYNFFRSIQRLAIPRIALDIIICFCFRFCFCSFFILLLIYKFCKRFLLSLCSVNGAFCFSLSLSLPLSHRRRLLYTLCDCGILGLSVCLIDYPKNRHFALIRFIWKILLFIFLLLLVVVAYWTDFGWNLLKIYIVCAFRLCANDAFILLINISSD